MPNRSLRAAAAVVTAICLTGCTSSGAPKPSGSAAVTSNSGSTSASAPASTTPASASATTAATTAAPLARFASLGGGATTIGVEPAFVRSLYTGSITTAAAGDARLTVLGRGSRIVLPITGGKATVYARSAAARSTVTARHGGSGLRLGNRAGVTVRVDDFVVTLGSTPKITAQVATVVDGATGPSKPVTLFTVRTTAATASSLTRGVATLTGLRLYLTTEARTALGAALSTTAFRSTSTASVATLSVTLAAR